MSQYPLLKEEAGNTTWKLLHHRASLYSDKPTDKEKQRMKDFVYESMKSVAMLCDDCRKHIKEYLLKNPLNPALEGKNQLSMYLCNFHNSVRQRQNKDTIDCKNILRPLEKCKDCKHEIQKDSEIKKELELKDTFEKFKQVSASIFHKLCDRYKLPYPTIKFHECPTAPSTSCTSMWVNSETKDIIERPVVYLHPNVMGLRTIVHEFMHYARQMNKDSLGAIDEHKIEREAQGLLSNEFPYDSIEKEKYLKGPTIIDKPLIVRDTLASTSSSSYISKFPMASSVYDKEQHFCCFECDEKITVPAGSIKGEIIQCSNCSQDFELLDNGVVVKAEKIGEDWGE